MRTKVDRWIAFLFSRMLHAGRRTWPVSVLIIVVLLAFSAILVYNTGGTHQSYVHAAYFPILLAGLFFGALGGSAVGLAAGIVMGPFMPLDVAGGTDQDTISHLARTAAFILIGGFAGTLFQAIGRYLDIMRSQAFQDPITGLPNRSKLIEDLGIPESVSNPCIRSKKAKAYVIVVKVEQFGMVLATLGHDYADTLLRQVAGRLQNYFRDDESVYPHLYDLREGNLAVLVRAATPGAVSDFTERLADSFDRPFVLHDIPILVEGRFGVSKQLDRDGDPIKVIRSALAALEDSGTQANPIAFYDPSRDERRRNTVSLLADFRLALVAGNQLGLHMQPKLSLRDRRCRGVEALLRWHHPTRGMVPPGLFIPQVERTGMVEAMTGWVLGAALEQIVVWNRQGITLPVAVNISVRDLERPGFVESLDTLLRHYCVDPGMLEVEVTESAVMNDPEGALHALASLSEMGVTIALDDFGTGQSSVAYLQKLPIDVVKLDRALIQNLGESRRSWPLIAGIARLADQFGQTTVAEGIEDEKTANLLAKLNCTMGQGYFFARPMPAEAVTGWLLSR